MDENLKANFFIFFAGSPDRDGRGCLCVGIGNLIQVDPLDRVANLTVSSHIIYGIKPGFNLISG